MARRSWRTGVAGVLVGFLLGGVLVVSPTAQSFIWGSINGVPFGPGIILTSSAYINWSTPSGTNGYGIRDNAGTMQFKNSGGAWADIVSAASGGGWTDDGTVVRLTTGTDNVVIGGTTANGKLDVETSQQGLEFGAGATPYIQAYDRASPGYLPLDIFAGQIRFYAGGTLSLTFSSVTGIATFAPATLTGSAATSGIILNQTWNTTGAPAAFLMNITNTASGAAALLMDLQVGGVSQFSVAKTGAVSLGSAVFSGGRALTATTPSGNTVGVRLLQTSVADWEIQNVATTGALALVDSTVTRFSIAAATGNTTVGGTLTVSGAGPHAIGGATTTSYNTRITGTGITAINDTMMGLVYDGTVKGYAGRNVYGTYFAPIITKPTSGTSALYATSYFYPLTTSGGGGTEVITAATTVYVQGAPTAGSTNYALWVDAGNTRLDGNLEVQGAGPHAFGGTTTGRHQFRFTGTFTSDGSSTNAIGLYTDGSVIGAAGDTSLLAGARFVTAITTQTAVETIDDVASVSIWEPQITKNVTTITNASTLKIENAPTEGTNNYALWVAAGLSRFDGGIAYGTTAGCSGTPSASLGGIVTTCAGPEASPLALLAMIQSLQVEVASLRAQLMGGK